MAREGRKEAGERVRERERELSLPRDLLEQRFSNLRVDMNHVGILLLCTFWFGVSGVKPKMLHF